MTVSAEDHALLQRLEESLWRPESRYSPAHLERVLAAGFTEFGRSGRRYSRRDILAGEPAPIEAVLPLRAFEVAAVGSDLVLVTYVSEATYDGVVELTNRTSLWRRGGPEGYELVFHQGTPTTEDLLQDG